MSYCRFSSDDWASDVYVYESDLGHEVHVAGRRRIFRTPLPAPVPLSSPPTKAEIDATVQRHLAVNALVRDHCDLVPIDHVLAGASYTCDGPAETLERLLMLRREGFHVPENALTVLAEEVEDEVAEVDAAQPDTVGRCRCDGAEFDTDAENAARRPFLTNPECPVHSADR